MNARRLLILTFLAAGYSLPCSGAVAASDAAAVASQAQAILRQHCFQCHGEDPDNVSGELNVFDRQTLLAPDRMLVVPKSPDKSELMIRVADPDEDNRMPPTPNEALSAEDQATLREWIAQGAPEFPEQSPTPQPADESASASTATHDADGARLAAQVKEVFRAHCLECHGGAKTNAGIRILDHDSLIGKKKLMPGKPEQSSLVKLLVAEDRSVMPPNGQPRLAAADVEAVRRWIAAGAAPFPADVTAPEETGKDESLKDVVGVDYVLKQILEHRRSLPNEARPYVRYFSIHHLLTGGATREELDLQRDALAKTINHLSNQRDIAHLEAIDEPLSTVFALDIRKVGWHRQPFSRMVNGTRSGKSDLNVFDLALLEYPYGIVYEDSVTYDRLVEEFIRPARLARPIPYVRADWFVSIITQPPLYEDFLGLPMDLESLERQLGVNSEQNIEDGTAKRAGMTVSGVSRNNRVVERHPTSNGAYWKSFDFGSSKGPQSMFHHPIEMQPDGGEMIFTLPNGLQGYFVTTAAGERLDRAPTDIVTDKFAENQTVVNGLSCIRCHDAGMKTFADNVRPAIEKLPGSSGIDKRHALELYPPVAEMDQLVERDARQFMSALTEALGHPQQREPLIPVTQRFLDAPIQLTTASAELGLPNTDGLSHLFRSPQFVALGLIPLASQGAIRRDAWEDYYDQIVRMLGLGTPVVPLDGLNRLDYPAVSPSSSVKLSTNKKNNVFAPGEELVIFVNNSGPKPVHIELIGTSPRGEKVILAPASTILRSGEQFRFPSEGGLRIQPSLGKELITLYACEEQFPAGELLRGEGVVDRVYHPFYELSDGPRGQRMTFDPAKMVKQTVAIETQ